MTGPAWMRQAACLDHPALPWTTDTALTTAGQQEAMAGVCAACPVWASCWAHAATEDITGGYWAGIDRDTLTPTTTRPRTRKTAA